MVQGEVGVGGWGLAWVWDGRVGGVRQFFLSVVVDMV